MHTEKEYQKLDKENERLEAELEFLQDNQADWGYEMLCRFDQGAAGSTDLYTYIACLIDDLDRFKERIKQIKDTINDDKLCDTIAKQCHDSCHDDRWCSTCCSRGDGIDAYQKKLQKKLGIKK
jgi:hypothetical protein